MKKILFSDQTPVAYRGRNGMGKMSGIEVHYMPAGYVSLNPVTSKGTPSDAAVFEIPYGDTIPVCAGILGIDQPTVWAAYCMLKGATVKYGNKWVRIVHIEKCVCKVEYIGSLLPDVVSTEILFNNNQ